MSAVGADTASAAPRLTGPRWALLAGNFAIACGVTVVPGTLIDLAGSLQVSVAVAGQLITVAAVVMCLGAPLAAGFVAGIDRRRLLTCTLALYALGHLLCALAPSYPWLLPLRALSVLGAAVFTPQAAAAIGHMAAPQDRGRALTFVFLGWSLASVLGMPLNAYVSETLGWRYAFCLVALLAAIATIWVWQAMPDGVKPAPLSLAAWKSVLTHPVLMAIVGVTALAGAGQFTLFGYMAPYYRQTFDASAAQISGLFFWFGLWAFVGNLVLTRTIDKLGPARAVMTLLTLIAFGLLAWPLATGMLSAMLILLPWGLGGFAYNSAQQARLGMAVPALAPALMSLNTSAIYLGQAAGAAGGGALIAAGNHYELLHWVGAGWVALAMGLSLWAAQRMQRLKHA